MYNQLIMINNNNQNSLDNKISHTKFQISNTIICNKNLMMNNKINNS